MKLWFVSANYRSDNLDVFVWATNPHQAIAHWRNYYGCLVAAATKPRVWAVPTTEPKKAGTVAWWHDMKPVEA